ncbi:MAG: pyroglutamyl-peptidase [Candidatus Eremiobacteraeota bacterium]|nr:pyroglutamyl-peptidase [Candidatus Eremiobacteraeota bacterium]
MSRHVLLTGFEPFGTHTVNPSEMLVRSLEGRVIGGRAVAVRVLPVETRTLRQRTEAALREERPEIVIGVGYAPGRPSLALERAALNVLDFTIPDAAGTMRTDDPVLPGGPDARLSTLPLAAIIEAWTAAGIPGYVSNSAGTYICNQWLYEALALTAGSAPPAVAGFVHVPALPAQALAMGADRTPSMTLDLMRRGLETAIEAIALSLDTKPAGAAPRNDDKVWITPRTTRT